MTKKFSKLGFSQDNHTVSYCNGVIAKMHLDLYADNEYTLFGRVIADNVKYVKKDGRIILYNRYGDVILDAALQNISNGMMKSYSDTCREYIFTIKGIKYRMVISQNNNN